MVGEFFFLVLCGVHQGGVLPPFSVYVNDLIVHLSQSGYGDHVVQLFAGCAVYADDLALLSASCYRLQKNLLMPAHITEQNAISNVTHLRESIDSIWRSHSYSSCVITLNGSPIPRVTKVKYLGLHFLCNSGMVCV